MPSVAATCESPQRAPGDSGTNDHFGLSVGYARCEETGLAETTCWIRFLGCVR